MGMADNYENYIVPAIMDSEAKTTGGCMCGAIRYGASGKPLDVAYCHCESCRKHTGAPVVASVAFEISQVRFLTKRSAFESTRYRELDYAGIEAIDRRPVVSR